MPPGADDARSPVPLFAGADSNLQIFARTLAHDFNNLITGILGHAALIEAIAPLDDPDIAESAAIIRRAAERAAELNAQLMNLSAGAAPRMMPVDLHETIREVAALLAPSLAHTVTVDLDLSASYSHVTGDPGQLHQVLLNLAVNARDAMAHGGLLRFATACTEGAVTVCISDTGSGIPIELHERIFEPLFTTKGEGKGTGLGLAVVKRVVGMHSGTIDLRSAPGFGSTFCLRFPLAAGTARDANTLSIAAGA